MPITLSAAQEQALARIRNSKQMYVVGIDEVGYGACAGPVTVCAAVVRKGWEHPEVRDSKKVSRYVRARLVEKILIPHAGVEHLLMSHDNKVIDHMGVTKARDDLVFKLVQECLEVFPSSIVVMDGNVLPEGVPSSAVCLPKADDLVAAVSAASIIAKEHRDEVMRDLAKQYPGYDFQHNVGYSSPKHMSGLDRLGPCAIHRMSYRNVAERGHLRNGQAPGWAH